MMSPSDRQTLQNAALVALFFVLAALAIRCSDMGDDAGFHLRSDSELPAPAK